MSLRCATQLMTLVLALVACDAQAFFDPPWVTPAAPREGEVVSVNIHGGICDAIFEWPGYPQITEQGNALRIVEYGAHIGSVDWCIYGVGTLTEPIGTFSPGDYTLTVDLLYDDPLYGPTTMSIGIVQFTVAGAARVESVPTFGLRSVFAAIFVIVCLGCRSLRTLRRSGC